MLAIKGKKLPGAVLLEYLLYQVPSPAAKVSLRWISPPGLNTRRLGSRSAIWVTPQRKFHLN